VRTETVGEYIPELCSEHIESYVSRRQRGRVRYTRRVQTDGQSAGVPAEAAGV